MATRAEGRRGKFPSTWVRHARRARVLGGEPSHGTQRTLDPGARRRANKRSMDALLRNGRKRMVAYNALAKEEAK